MTTHRTQLLAVLGLATAGCGTEFSPSTALGEDAFGTSGLRRLDRFEVTGSLEDIYGVPAADLAATLPEDQAGTNPFDNNFASQTVSPLVISSYAAFAQAYGERLGAQADLPDRLGHCTPVVPDDRACFDAYARAVGRRMFRRPVTNEELDAFAAALLPYAAADQSFSTAVALLGETMVQHPAFLYRLEQEGALDPYEVATRISFLLWGTGPDDELLDAAEADQLGDAGRRAKQAQRMLGDAKARRNWQRFHAMWLGFSDAPLPAALRDDLLTETNHLIDRVIFDDNDEWMTLFRANETFLTPQLATQYALPAVTAPQWVTYPAGRGGGVLAHGSFLTLGAKFGDTSPTQRGAQIYKRLTCESLGSIPPNVDTDMPPGLATDCKPQRYTMRATAGCDSCHGIVDNIGFGLENFGVAGAWRETEPGHPQCAIDGTGAWANQPFRGPAELGALIADDPRVAACATTQLFRFMTGRDEDARDARTLAQLADQLANDGRLTTMLVELVGSPAITYRKGD